MAVGTADAGEPAARIAAVQITLDHLFDNGPEEIAVSKDLLTAGKRSAIVGKITEVFNEFYPLPDVAANMTNDINRRLKTGEYDRFTGVPEFTSQLTEDLRSISKDFHIKVLPYEKIPDGLLAEIRLGSPDDNYGFAKVVRMPGNIGYLDLRSFNNPRTAGPTAVAAMNFLAHCAALIIDLRVNGEGDEAMAQILSSYFFEKSTHMTDCHIRKNGVTEQRWSQEWVPCPKMTGIPTGLHPVVLAEAALAAYPGSYKNVKISHECGRLHLERNGKEKQELVPMGNDLFKYKDPDEAHYRVQFVRDGSGRVIEFYDLDSDGDRYPAKKREG